MYASLIRPVIPQDLRQCRDATVISEGLSADQGIPPPPWDNQVIGRTATPLVSIRLAAAEFNANAGVDRALAIEAARVRVVLDSARFSHPRRAYLFTACVVACLFTVSRRVRGWPQE